MSRGVQLEVRNKLCVAGDHLDMTMYQKKYLHNKWEIGWESCKTSSSSSSNSECAFSPRTDLKWHWCTEGQWKWHTSCKGFCTKLGFHLCEDTFQSTEHGMTWRNRCCVHKLTCFCCPAHLRHLCRVLRCAAAGLFTLETCSLKLWSLEKKWMLMFSVSSRECKSQGGGNPV